MYRSILVFTFLTAILISCTEDRGINGENVLIMPLSLDFKWEGTLTTYSPDGILIDENDFKILLSDEITINGENWFAAEYVIDGDTIDSDIAFANLDAGLYRRKISGDSILIGNNLWAKYPARIGETYYYESDTSGNMSVFDVDTVVSVPYSEFTCYCYRLTVGTTFPELYYYYLAPNFGLVKWEKYRPGPVDDPYLYEMWELYDFDE